MSYNLNDIQLRNELHEKGLRKCPKCGEIKPYVQYSKKKNSFSGYGHYCKPCKSIIDKEYRSDPKRKDDLLSKKKAYYKKIRTTDHYQNYQKERNRNRDYKSEYRRMMQNENRRFKNKLRQRIHSYFRTNRDMVRPDSETFKLLGADLFTVKEFISRQFLPGMSWDNHGEWHMDHVIPLDAANKDVDIMTRLCYYQNLMPMWGKDNLHKSYEVPDICTLWANPIVPYKVADIVIHPKNPGIVGIHREPTPIGKRFGMLTVINEGQTKILTSGVRRRTMLCTCDCGNQKTMIYASLKSGNTKSCGCYYRKKNK